MTWGMPVWGMPKLPSPAPAPTDPSRLAEEARRLLADPVLMAAFAAVERKLRDTWAASTIDDALGRERVFAMLHALGRVKSELQLMVGNGRMIAAEMERREAAAARSRE